MILLYSVIICGFHPNQRERGTVPANGKTEKEK